jgi:hypothetical protein
MGVTIHYRGRIDRLEAIVRSAGGARGAVAQLKRALRGLAFAHGTTFLAAEAGTLDPDAARTVREEIDALTEAALGHLREQRARPPEE